MNFNGWAPHLEIRRRDELLGNGLSDRKAILVSRGFSDQPTALLLGVSGKSQGQLVAEWPGGSSEMAPIGWKALEAMPTMLHRWFLIAIHLFSTFFVGNSQRFCWKSLVIAPKGPPTHACHAETLRLQLGRFWSSAAPAGFERSCATAVLGGGTRGLILEVTVERTPKATAPFPSHLTGTVKFLQHPLTGKLKQYLSTFQIPCDMVEPAKRTVEPLQTFGTSTTKITTVATAKKRWCLYRGHFRSVKNSM